ncbi:unnamed protein product [Lactuca saligna]|uniref:RRM domain-containing protein n=1 Tax=Lactuca saligna TaxID=75948 RepID=A0AA35VD29_LACSI|nr:unnamed protein product [Lactuca saligna]
MENWTDVRRRKAPTKSQTGLDETSFFVLNIPTGVTKEEFRKIFKPFGELTDIYFGGRKGKNGKYFGFIRFKGVRDVGSLEAGLNGMLCRNHKLDINIAKHERKLPKSFIKTGSKNHKSTLIPAGGGFVGSRSYAKVIGA